MRNATRAAIAGALVLAGCANESWSRAPAGPQAGRIADLWWFFFSVTTAVWLIMLALIAWAVWRGHRRAAVVVDTDTQRRQALAVSGAAALTILALVTLTLADLLAARGLTTPPDGDVPLVIRVTGHRWWWELTYENEVPARRLTTANEIHIPVGRPVLLEVTSQDVIHSLWLPRLNGKRDLIPGYRSSFWIQAVEPGTYSGRCAEFCGLQHARMQIEVVAETPQQFAAWYEAQLRAAEPPTDDRGRRGLEVFLSGPCVMCHAIRGTPAGSRIGPDLTHVASRRTLAAGVLPNSRAHLARWILDAQGVKPGNVMPSILLPSADLEPLLDYLEGLR